MIVECDNVKLKKMDLLSKLEKYPNYLGFVDLTEGKCLGQIKHHIKGLKIDCLVVLGAGGSYLTAKAAIQLFGNLKVIFLGNSFDFYQIKKAVEEVKEKDFAINIISKSGTTKEPLLAFPIFERLLRKQKNDEKKYIFVTTTEGSSLDKMARQKGYQRLYIPDNAGGRFSGLSVAGLFPMALAGINIKKILKGARKCREEIFSSPTENECLKYAQIRYLLEIKNKKNIEILTSFNYRATFLYDMIKQLFAESLGKDGKGLFPVSAFFSDDLHSLGQLIQEGRKSFFETFLIFKENNGSEKFDKINDIAFNATIQAHKKAGVPIVKLKFDKLDESNFGYILFFFQMAAVFNGVLLKINPFDQNGVEEYKRQMESFN